MLTRIVRRSLKRPRRRVVAFFGFLAMAALGTILGPVSTATRSAGAQGLDAPMRADEVCFTVHNEGDPTPANVYGVRFSVGEPRSETKVIILVHGHSVTH